MKILLVLRSLLLFSSICLVFTGRAQVNTWTNPASGRWHEPFWSLGVMPNINQSEILFGNPDSSLTIDSMTARDYPASLTISNLQVSSPGNSFNSLLLNYAGVRLPLRIEDKFYLGSNSTLVTLGSALHVGNQLLVDGTVTHGALSEVTAGTLGLGVNGRAVYNLGSGLVTASNIVLGFWRPWEASAPPARFDQDGGAIRTGYVEIHSGEYALRDGELAVAGITVGDAAIGFFRQLGGRLVVTNGLQVGAGDSRTDYVGSGHFDLMGGTLSTRNLQIGAATDPTGNPGGNGSFVQSGGTNSAGELHVGPFQSYSSGDYNYTLNNGLLQTSNSIVNGYADLVQSGGIHSIAGLLVVQGYGTRHYQSAGADYRFNKGTIRCRGLTVKTAAFSQSGWNTTNRVDGDLVVGEDLFLAGTSYYLSAGQLITSNTVVAGSHRGTIVNSGGSHTVSGILDLHRPITYYSGAEYNRVRYELQVGYLSARHIRVSTNSVFRHISGGIANTGLLTLAGGTWESASGEHALGGLKLEASSTNSSVLLPGSSNVLRFASSAATAWDAGARLVIHNWRGVLNGGGQHRVIFGDSSAGLTPAQLNQIRFLNPATLPAGEYAAAILASGEIVPLQPTGRGPSITFQQTSGQLRMEWGSGYTLQTATNIAGPFTDVSTNSPYIADPRRDPQRYYRFRE